MRDQAIGRPDLSLALAEPTRHVRRRWIIGLTLASLGMWMANQTPLQVMLALRLFPGQTAADGLLILILIYTGCVVLTSIVGGIISDRSGRRKMLVTVSGLLMAAAALLLTFQETWPAALGAAVLYGTGYGAYIAVDQALITQVLPTARDRAKDLGIINIAIVCPGAIGALIAAPLVSLAGYPALFGATAAVAIAASAGVWRIKSVR